MVGEGSARRPVTVTVMENLPQARRLHVGRASHPNDSPSRRDLCRTVDSRVTDSPHPHPHLPVSRAMVASALSEVGLLLKGLNRMPSSSFFLFREPTRFAWSRKLLTML